MRLLGIVIVIVLVVLLVILLLRNQENSSNSSGSHERHLASAPANPRVNSSSKGPKIWTKDACKPGQCSHSWKEVKQSRGNQRHAARSTQNLQESRNMVNTHYDDNKVPVYPGPLAIKPNSLAGEFKESQFHPRRNADLILSFLTDFVETPNSRKAYRFPDVTWDFRTIISAEENTPERTYIVKDTKLQDIIELTVAMYGYGLALSSTNTMWTNGFEYANGAFERTIDTSITNKATANAVAVFRQIIDWLDELINTPLVKEECQMTQMGKTKKNTCKNVNVLPSQLDPEDRMYVDITHDIAMRLLKSMALNHYNLFNSDVAMFQAGGYEQEYMPVWHKSFGPIYHYYSSVIGMIFFEANFWGGNRFYRFVAPFISNDYMRRIPQQMLINNARLRKMLDEIKEGSDMYFMWRGMYIGDNYGSYQGADGVNAFKPHQYTTGDVEGFTLYPEISAELMSDSNFAITFPTEYYEPIEEFMTRTGLPESSYRGINRPADTHVYDTFIGTDRSPVPAFKNAIFDSRGTRRYVPYLEIITYKLGDPEEAELIVDSMINIWDNETRPIITAFYNATKKAVENSFDDDYPGLWRMKIKQILGMERDSEYLATGVIIPFDLPLPRTAQNNGKLTVPLVQSIKDQNTIDQMNHNYIGYQSNAAAGSSEYNEIMDKILETQAGIKELYAHYTQGLSLSLNLNDGVNSKYLGVTKRNTTKGLDTSAGQTSPYQTAEEILANYDSTSQIIDNNLPTIVHESGVSLFSFFDDFKQYYLNQYVQNNPSLFGFSNPSAAGLFKYNDANQQILSEDVVSAVDSEGYNALSDVVVLGRHYGYNADGTIKADEWAPYPKKIDESVPDSVVYQEYQPEPIYKWGFPNGSGGYYVFDYIYAQHYKIPLKANGERNYSMAAFNAMAPSEKLVFDVDEWNKWAKIEYEQCIYDYGNRGTYFAFKFDYCNNMLADYFLRTGADRNLFSHQFIAKFGFFAFNNVHAKNAADRRLADTYLSDPSLQQYVTIDGVDYNQKYAHINIYNRANREQSAGSANSGRFLDVARNVYGVSQGYTTSTPHTELTAIANIGTFIHEGALGHGFDEIPNNIAVLVGDTNEQSWLTLGNDIAHDPEFWNYSTMVKPGAAVIGEGWATFGEFVGIVYGYYILIDDAGDIDPNQVADSAIILGLNGVSRLASRQIIDAGTHDPRYAYTFNRMVTEQYEISNINKEDSFFRNMLQRFVIGWAQQTTYAGGLIGNLGTNAYLKSTVELNYGPGSYNFGAFVEFRINETDFIMGATLTEIAIANLNKFVMPGIPLKDPSTLIYP